MSVTTHKVNALEPIGNRVLVKNMVFGDRMTAGGILLPGDDRKSAGIRPRWAEVYAVGPDQTDIVPGEWVLVSHGRWTRAMKFDINDEEMVIQMVDNDEILLVSDVPQIDSTMSTAVHAQSDNHRIEGSMHNHAGGGITG